MFVYEKKCFFVSINIASVSFLITCVTIDYNPLKSRHILLYEDWKQNSENAPLSEFSSYTSDNVHALLPSKNIYLKTSMEVNLGVLGVYNHVRRRAFNFLKNAAPSGRRSLNLRNLIMLSN